MVARFCIFRDDIGLRITLFYTCSLFNIVCEIANANVLQSTVKYKSLSGDEIANVNIFTTISHTYLKIPIKRTYSV